MNLENTKLKWIAYCRKSTESEEKQILSIDAQKRELKTLAEKQGVEVTGLLSESKTAYKTGRTEFNKMLSLIESGEVNAILVYHLSRLARNTSDGGRIIYLMDEGKLKTICTPTRTYVNNPDDKFFLQIEFGMSKKSSDDTSTYVKRDIDSKLLKGEYPSLAPIGYLNIDKDGKIAGKMFDSKKQVMLEDLGRPLKRIEKDQIAAPLLRKLFEQALTGKYNLRELYEYANEIGLRTTRFNRRLNKSTVWGILTNPFYYGMIRFRGLTDHQGIHDTILTKDEFDRIQENLHNRSRPRPKRWQFPFRGLVKCEVCGMSVVGLTKTKPSGRSYTYYVCSKRRGNCGQGGIRAEELEKQISERLKAATISERLWKVSVRLLKESYGSQIEEQEKLKKGWEHKHRQVEMKLKRLLDLRIDGSLDDEEYKAKKAELAAEKQKLGELIANATQNNTDWLSLAEEFFEFAHTVYKDFQTGDIDQKKAVVAKVGWNLKLKDGILAWEYKKPFNFLVERPSVTESVTDSVGTPVYPVISKQNASFVPQFELWRARPDSNRRSSP